MSKPAKERLLTTRQEQIVGLAAQGLANKAIAQRLNISAGTVKVHLHNVFEKLGIKSRSMLVDIHAASAKNEAGPPRPIRQVVPLQ